MTPQDCKVLLEEIGATYLGVTLCVELKTDVAIIYLNECEKYEMPLKEFVQSVVHPSKRWPLLIAISERPGESVNPSSYANWRQSFRKYCRGAAFNLGVEEKEVFKMIPLEQLERVYKGQDSNGKDKFGVA